MALLSMAHALSPIARLYVMPGCLACSVAKRDLQKLENKWAQNGIVTEVVTVSRENSPVAAVPTATYEAHGSVVGFTGTKCCKDLNAWVLNHHGQSAPMEGGHRS